MYNLYRKILTPVQKILPNRSIKTSKKLWNKLAEKNPRYYIVSKEGKDIDVEKFRQIGLENYTNLIKKDLFLLNKLGDCSTKNVLDIGCGIGRITRFFANDFKMVYGVDISEKMITQGKEYTADLQNVSLVATDGIHYPFDDNFFDLVFSYIVFQHMSSVEVVEENLKEVFRVLKPNSGIAKIQLRGGAEPFKWHWFYGPSFSLGQATALVNKVGFRILKTEDESKKRFWLWLSK